MNLTTWGWEGETVKKSAKGHPNIYISVATNSFQRCNVLYPQSASCVCTCRSQTPVYWL